MVCIRFLTILSMPFHIFIPWINCLVNKFYIKMSKLPLIIKEPTASARQNLWATRAAGNCSKFLKITEIRCPPIKKIDVPKEYVSSILNRKFKGSIDQLKGMDTSMDVIEEREDPEKEEVSTGKRRKGKGVDYSRAAVELENKRTGVYKMGPKKLRFRNMRYLEGKNRHLKETISLMTERARSSIRSFIGEDRRSTSLMTCKGA